MGIGGLNLDTDPIGEMVRWVSTFSESDYFLERTSGMKKIQLFSILVKLGARAANGIFGDA